MTLFVIISIFCLSQTSASQIKLADKDKREIIKLILNSEDFSDARESFEDKMPNLSTENIPLAIQNNFPKIEGANFHLLAPEYIQAAESIYYFSFGKFRTTKKSVYIWFFENNYGGGGNGDEKVFQKIKGKWKMIKPKSRRFKVWNT